MARDESLLGSLDMAIATVRRQFYDSEARPLARRHHIRVGGALAGCQSVQPRISPASLASAALRVMLNSSRPGVRLAMRTLLVSTMRPLGARLTFYALVKSRSTIVSE